MTRIQTPISSSIYFGRAIELVKKAKAETKMVRMLMANAHHKE